MEYSWALLIQVGRKSGWRKSASFRETMKGHVEAGERVEALHHEADSDTEEGMEFRVKGFSPRALRQDFTIEATQGAGSTTPRKASASRP